MPAVSCAANKPSGRIRTSNSAHLICQNRGSCPALPRCHARGTLGKAASFGARVPRPLFGQSTDETRLATIRQAGNNFRDSTPSLSTAAWDAAVASHAVDYLAHDELTRYSHLYAMQRSFTQALWDTVRDSAVHSMTDLTLPVYVGKADPVATIGVLSARTQALQVMASQLSQLDAALSAARAAAPSVAASVAASH